MQSHAWFPLLVVLAANCFAPSRSDGALVAYWHFNNYNGADTSIPADVGAATDLISIVGFTGDTAAFAGTSINAVGGTVAGADLGLLDEINNGQSLTIHITGTGLSDFVLSYATQRSGTGFTVHQWAYSTDNINFTDVSSVSPPTPYALRTVDFTSITGIDDQPDIYFRAILTGATGSTGNNRFDNLQINTVPEPAHYALICVLALAAFAGGSTWLETRRKLKR